jgi:DNA invertase Pin-like site-specific DNA recombinase/outer membrane lipoprotein-sorting protein
MLQRVAVYARYSSDNQRDASIDDQLRDCRARAEREDWQIVETYTDYAISGAVKLRSGYQDLLAAVRERRVDLVLAESLDRFARDLEFIAALHKECTFHQVRVYTLREGEIGELQIGLKGTMGALYLKELAENTRRGLKGRIEAGRCTGSPPYGYRIVRQLTENGTLERGLREIDPDRAAVVRRIFDAYVGGASPQRIARQLNAEGIPGPGGGIWYDASIRGRPRRQDGILRNELYIGSLVWQRRRNAKYPKTGVRVRRDAPPDTFLRVGVPQLRIIDDDLWQRVQQRLVEESAPLTPGRLKPKNAFWDRRRPRHLLSQKVVCGTCGRHFTPTGKDYLGCPAAKHGNCSNTSTVRRVTLEDHAMDLLSRQVMQPDLVADFVAAFNQEADRLSADLRSQAATRQREVAALERKVANFLEAIGDGRSSPAIMAKLAELEARLSVLTAPSTCPPDSPTHMLHPGIAENYARKAGILTEALREGGDPEVLEAARALIDRIVIHAPRPDGGPPGIELVGELTAMLNMARGNQGIAGDQAAPTDPVLALFVSSVKEAPGAEPLAFLPSPRVSMEDEVCATRGRGVSRGGAGCHVGGMRDFVRFAVVALAVCAAGVPGRVWADPHAAVLSDQDHAVLQGVEAYLNNLHALKARFLQIGPDGVSNTGTAWLDRPGRMRFEYDKPSPLLLVAGHGVVVFRDNKLDQTTNIPMSQTPLGLLLRDRIVLGGDVTVTDFEQPPGAIQVTLVKTASPGDGSLTLLLNANPLALAGWSVVDAQGRETRVRLSNVVLGGDYPDSLFTYADPAGDGNTP